MSFIPMFIEYLKQSDSDAESSNTTPKVSSSSRRITDNQVHGRCLLVPLKALIDHVSSQKSDSELSSLVDEPSKKKFRGKSKVNPLIPLCRIPILQYETLQISEAGKLQVKSKRSKQTPHTLSKDEETIKRLKVPILDFMGPVHASDLPNFPSPSSLHAA